MPPREELLYVWIWAVVLPMQELQGTKGVGQIHWPLRGKGKDRKGESLSVAREENVKVGQLAGSVHHLAGRGKVGPWFICPSPVG